MAPVKIRKTANSRTAGDSPGLPDPVRQRPWQPVNTVMQRFSLRTETVSQPLPVILRMSVRAADNINSNSAA